MTIKEAKEFLNNTLNQTTSSGEIKIYKKFIDVLKGLEKQQFSAEEINQIETELNLLDLNLPTKNRKKHIKKALHRFMSYLKKNYSLTAEGHYTNLGIALGMCFGSAFGTVFNQNGTGIAIGICIGMCVGIIVGKYMDNEAVKNNQVLYV